MQLAADIGGTKGNFALVDPAQPGRMFAEATLASRDFPDLTSLVRAYLEHAGQRPARACLAVPGPVVAGRAVMATLDWVADEGALASDLGLGSVRLINDLVATACGLPLLPAADLVTLHPGECDAAAAPVAGEVRAVIAPGTGLGESFCTYDGARWCAHPSEGGHAAFAPHDEDGVDLWRFAHARDGFVTMQSVCSGLGIATIWRWLGARGRGGEPAAVSAAITAAMDPTRELLAHLDTSERCRMAVERFVELLADEAADIALRLLPMGGIYLGGGLPPRLLPFLRDGRFVRRYLAHPELSHLHRRIPLQVVLNPKTALLGAVYHGA